MTRRESLKLALGAAAAPANLRGAPRRPGDKPNLLFLLTDEQRADTMAAYGQARYRVPGMNRLASRSLIFDRCYVTQPVCTPARSSLLTGLRPHQNGCIWNNIAPRPEARTLPELPGDSSYRTAYMGKWHLGDEIFAQHGFETWVSVEDYYSKHYSPGRDPSQRCSYHQYLLAQRYKPDQKDGLFSRLFGTTVPAAHSKPSFLAQEASEFILKHRGEPWMLHLGFLEPHMPFHGALSGLHAEQEAPLPENYPGLPVAREPRSYGAIREQQRKTGVAGPAYQVLPGHRLKGRADYQLVARGYAGLCSLVDQALARIFWALEASGQADNTVVVLTSDHGEMLGSHSLIGKWVMYEEAVRVPLLIHAPFLRHGRRVAVQPVSHIGLVPAPLEMLGRPVPETLPGQSLMKVADGRAPAGDVFIEWHGRDDGIHGRTFITPEGRKLAVYNKDNALLFDRRRDPLEMRNLYYETSSGREKLELSGWIGTWQRAVNDELALPGV